MSIARHLHRRARLIAVATGLALCAPAAAMAQPSDQVLPSDHHAIATHARVVVPNPDGQDAALASQARVVVPSPDARDAALAATTTSRPDPRSPDARDAATNPVRSPSQPATSPVIVHNEHPDALPIALAGAALLLALLAAGGVAQLTRGRRNPVSVGH